MACRLAASTPSRACASGRILLTNTSTVAARRCNAASPAGAFRSSAMDFLPRLKLRNLPFMPGERPLPASWRSKSPPGLSSLITSAPCSARTPVQTGPTTTEERSSTRIPASGPLMVLPSKFTAAASHGSAAGQIRPTGTATAPCIRRRALR